MKNEVISKLPPTFKGVAPIITNFITAYQPKSVGLIAKFEPWIIMRKLKSLNDLFSLKISV
jgi:hypothetical protein